MNRKTLLVLSLSATLGATPLLHAQEQAPQRTLGSVERSHASQARALLDQAVLTFQAKGPPGQGPGAGAGRLQRPQRRIRPRPVLHLRAR